MRLLILHERPRRYQQMWKCERGTYGTYALAYERHCGELLQLIVGRFSHQRDALSTAAKLTQPQ